MYKKLSSLEGASSVMACEPALKLFPKILNDHELFAAFSGAWTAEGIGLKNRERHDKFKEIAMRLWPAISEKESTGKPELESRATKTRGKDVKKTKPAGEEDRQYQLNKMAKK